MNTMRVSIILFTVTVCVVSAGAENFGLRQKQPAEQLPQSRTPLAPPVTHKRLSSSDSMRLSRIGDSAVWRITGGWRLADEAALWPMSADLFNAAYDTSALWTDVDVPGTVLSSKVKQGLYPDPYFGVNNLVIPEALCRTDWVYRTVFNAPKETPGRQAWIVFNGVNYGATVYLNGRCLGTIKGAFIRGRFDVTGCLRERDNVLVARVVPPPNPGIPHEESPRSGGQGPNGGQLCLDGPTFISSEGWDWVPGIRDRNTGLWQDVCLHLSGDVSLSDPQIVTDLPLPSLDKALIGLRVTLRNHSAESRAVSVVCEISEWSPEGNKQSVPVSVIRHSVKLSGEESKRIELDGASHPELALVHPKLWWPNGYGKPDLYVAKVRVESSSGQISDTVDVRFGVRELSYTLSVDTATRKDWRIELNPLKTYVTGKPIISNLDRREVDGKVCVPRLVPGADESLLTGGNDPAMGPYLVIKVNGVPIFCRGGNWGMDDAMKRVSRGRLEPAVRLHRDAGFTMVRNWTGENTEPEFYSLCDEYGLLVWNDFWYSTQGYNLEPNDHALFLSNVEDVVKRYRNHPCLAIWCPRNEGWANEQLEPQIAQLLAKEDPTRHYHGNSRLQNLRPSGPWAFIDSDSHYFEKLAFGFNTELGSFSVPTFETLKTFIAAEDLWPIGDVWYYHDFHGEQNQAGYRKAIAERYGEPLGAEDFCKRAQCVNYDSHRAMFEAWNSRLWNNASGLLLWMSHPAWPSMIWQLYSYDFETTGAFFGAKKACEPIHIQMNAHDRKVIALNVTRDSVTNATARLLFYSLNGCNLGCEQSKVVTLEANCSVTCFSGVLPFTGEPVLARLTLSDSSGRVISLNDYWLPGKSRFHAFASALRPALTLKVHPVDSTRQIVCVSNAGTYIAGALKLRLVKKDTGERVLPAFFSDGWFNLLPGESRDVRLDGWCKDIDLKECEIRISSEW